MCVRIKSTHRSTLRKTVALQCQNSEFLHVVQHFRIDGRSSTDHQSHTAAKHIRDLFESLLANIYADFFCIAVYLHDPADCLFLALFSDIFPDAFVQSLKYRGNAQNHGRFCFHQILSDVFEPFTISDRSTLVQRHQKSACALICMMQRQYGEKYIPVMYF